MLKLIAAILLAASIAHAADAPVDWIDPDTHHRVVRLSTDPGTESLYFHQYAYSPDGRKLLVSTPGGIGTIDLESREVDVIVPGRARAIMTGHKTGDIY